MVRIADRRGEFERAAMEEFSEMPVQRVVGRAAEDVSPERQQLRQRTGDEGRGDLELAALEVEVQRFGKTARDRVVTGGERWGPMLQRLAQALGHAHALAGIHTVAPTGAQLAADPEAARALLAQACRDVVRQMGVQAVILGGAGLAGMAAAVQPQVSVPVIDSVLAGATWALRAHPVPPERKVAGFHVAWVGVSQEMAALGTRCVG